MERDTFARMTTLQDLPDFNIELMKIISSKEVLRNKLFTVTDEIAHDPDGFRNSSQYRAPSRLGSDDGCR